MTAVQRREAFGVGTSCWEHIVSVFCVRAAVAFRMKTDPSTTIFADIVEPTIGHVAVVVPWGTTTRVQIRLGDVLAADVTRNIRHERVREIAREQRARFTTRST